MGVCWKAALREGKGHLRWDCWNICSLGSISPKKSTSAVWMAVIPCTLWIREKSVSCACNLSWCQGVEKQDQTQWKAGTCPVCFGTLLYSGTVQSCVTQLLLLGGWNPFGVLRGFAPEQAWNLCRTERGQKKYIAIEWVPVVGWGSWLSQLCDINILERLGMYQGCNNSLQTNTFLSKKAVVTEV